MLNGTETEGSRELVKWKPQYRVFRVRLSVVTEHCGAELNFVGYNSFVVMSVGVYAAINDRSVK